MALGILSVRVADLYRHAVLKSLRYGLVDERHLQGRIRTAVAVTDRRPGGAVGWPVVHRGPARALVRDPLHVEPVVQCDPELDDSRDDEQQREEDEGELGCRLTALAVGALVAAGVTGSSHENV